MINGGLVVTETYFPTLNPGDTVAYTFTSTVDMSALNGVFDIAAFTMLAGDKDNANDTAYGMVAHLNTVSAFPYYEDFESGIGSWIGSAGSSWQWGEPAKPIINHAASTSHCWTTNLTGNTLAGENSFLSGPCFDFSSLTNPFIRFNLWYETTMLSSSAILEASADQGATWTKIGNSTDSSGHWYNSFNSLFEPAWTGSSSGWVLMQHALDGFAGEPDVSIRVVYSGGFSIIPPTEGLAVDDMEIFECIVANADFTFTVNGNLVSFNNASTNSTHYEWDFGDGSGASTTNTSHTYSTPGSYTATLYAFNDCSVDTLTQVFNFTGIGENDETPVFSCHPNPGNGKFIVSGSTSAQSEIKMTVSNALGENVFSEVIPGTNGILNTEVDLTFLSKGIYFLNVATQQHSSVIKLVIE
jgi:PKD repeat protein